MMKKIAIFAIFFMLFALHNPMLVQSEDTTVNEEVSTYNKPWTITDCPEDHDHASEICDIPYHGQLLNWSGMPHIYDYGWNNTDVVWANGKDYKGYKFKLDPGQYDADIHHKITMYSDGEYLYLNLIGATIDGPSAKGTALHFTVDGVKTEFQLATKPTGWGTVDSIKSPGMHKVYLRHSLGGLSGSVVEDSIAYLHIRDTKHNPEFEFKLPLSAFAEQNSNIDLENIHEVTFTTGHHTHKGITIGGISTFPLLLGALCLGGVGYGVYKCKK